MFVEGHLDGGVDLALFEGFEEIAEGLRALGPLKGRSVAQGGKEDDRKVVAAAYFVGRFNAVPLALQGDVH